MTLLSSTILPTSPRKKSLNVTATLAVQPPTVHKSRTPPIQTLQTNLYPTHTKVARLTGPIRPLALPPLLSHMWIQIHIKRTGGRKNLAFGMSRALAKDEHRIIRPLIEIHHRKATTASRTPIVRTIGGKGAVTVKRAMAVPVGRDTDIRAGQNMARKLQGQWA